MSSDTGRRKGLVADKSVKVDVQVHNLLNMLKEFTDRSFSEIIADAIHTQYPNAYDLLDQWEHQQRKLKGRLVDTRNIASEPGAETDEE
jgi:hypothetical protein